MAQKQMDPDRYQMRDVKRRVAQNERDIMRLERRHTKLHGQIMEHLFPSKESDTEEE